MNDVINIINSRKSERSFLDKELSKKDKDIIIHAAMRAPTAGNMMLYSILEVEKQSDKDRLVETCDNQPFIGKSPFVLIFLADFQRWYDFYEYCGVGDMCLENGTEFEGPKEADLLLASSDALIAAQNAVIAAESLGIGSCYIGDIVENIEIHREMFNLPDMAFPITMLCFGYKKESSKDIDIRPRFPKEYIHFKNSYKKVDGKGFEDMFKHLGDDVKLVGRKYYNRKTGADFTKEMQRSVAVGIKNWKKDLK